jgi:hypothetical protein
MITITNTITIAITIAIAVAIAIISINLRPNAHTYGHNNGKWGPDSAGKSESEICSPQVRIVYLSCGI